MASRCACGPVYGAHHLSRRGDAVTSNAALRSMSASVGSGDWSTRPAARWHRGEQLWQRHLVVERIILVADDAAQMSLTPAQPFITRAFHARPSRPARPQRRHLLDGELGIDPVRASATSTATDAVVGQRDLLGSAEWRPRWGSSLLSSSSISGIGSTATTPRTTRSTSRVIAPGAAARGESTVAASGGGGRSAITSADGTGVGPRS